MANIGFSIVQGSAIGPTLYIVMKSDLHVISCINVIIKFADDTTLLVPENTDVGLDVELRHVIEWAESNGVAARKAHSLGGASSNSVLPRRTLLIRNVAFPFVQTEEATYFHGVIKSG